MGTLPAWSASMRAGITSRTTTRCPSSARHAAVTRPTYPAPKTAIRSLDPPMPPRRILTPPSEVRAFRPRKRTPSGLCAEGIRTSGSPTDPPRADPTACRWNSSELEVDEGCDPLWPHRMGEHEGKREHDRLADHRQAREPRHHELRHARGQVLGADADGDRQQDTAGHERRRLP